MEIVPPPKLSYRKYSINSQLGYQDFLELNSNFFYFGPSQTSIRMIVNMVNSSNIPNDIKQTQLQQICLQILNETALNEMQIAYWSVFNDRFVWENQQKGTRLNLICSALIVKERMEENVDYLICKYSEKDESFTDYYQRWAFSVRFFKADLREVNLKYVQLIKGKGVKVNYNFYVDEIIVHYQPYYQGIKLQKVNEVDEVEEIDEKIKEKIIADIYNILPIPVIPEPNPENSEDFDAFSFFPPPLVHGNNPSNNSSIGIFLYSSCISNPRKSETFSYSKPS